MIAWILKKVLGWASGPILDKVLGHLQVQKASEVERLKVEAGVDIEGIRANVAVSGYARDVVTAGMQHKAFWIPWLIAAVPLSAWFGWGVLDTIANGALPDVAELPPQLKEYADTVWSNIFYTGAGVAGAAVISRAIRRRG